MALLDFLRSAEGYTPRASWDYKQHSVGYGTKARYPGEVIDRDEAERRLQAEIAPVQGLLAARYPNLSPNQKDALTSFSYNVGTDWMNKPTRLRAALEAGDTQGAASVMREYNKAGGQVLPGLVTRRDKEAAMFLGGPVPDSSHQGQSAMPLTSAQPQPSGNWVDNLTASPLFMMGAGVLGSPNIGQGLMQGAQASQQAKLGNLKFAQYQEEADAKNRQRQLWEKVMQNPSHPLLAGVPEAMRPALMSMDPGEALKSLQKYQMTKALPDFGKAGLIFAKDGQFYTVQFGADGSRKVEPLDAGMAPAQGVISIDTGDGTQLANKATGAPVRTVDKNIVERERQEQVGKNIGELQTTLPKAKASLAAVEYSQKNVLDTIDRALPKVDAWTTGLAGRALSMLPGTDATDLQNLLTTVKANLGFDKLQDMRANSPTGGALGAVAIQELQALQAAMQSVEQSQSAPQLRENLGKLKALLTETQAMRQRAFEDTYRPVMGAPAAPGAVVPAPPTTGGGTGGSGYVPRGAGAGAFSQPVAGGYSLKRLD